MQHLGRDARSPVELLKATWKAFNDDKAQRLAAAVAYAAIFSIAPLFIVLVAIVGSVLDARGAHGGHAAALDSLLANIRANAGEGAATTVRSLIESSFNKPKTGLIAQILGCAPRTVEKHVERILQKTQTETRTAATLAQPCPQKATR